MVMMISWKKNEKIVKYKNCIKTIKKIMDERTKKKTKKHYIYIIWKKVFITMETK